MPKRSTPARRPSSMRCTPRSAQAGRQAGFQRVTGRADELPDAQGSLDLGTAAAGDRYNQLAPALADSRDKEHGGIVTNLDDLKMFRARTPVSLPLCAIPSHQQFCDYQCGDRGSESRGGIAAPGSRGTLYALAGMLVYIAFRFEWVYGAAAVLAVFHDVLITLGLFSIFHFEISLTVIAALLTLVGYSMNDTIVIFDRIRENTRLMRREPFPDIVNRSINQTLSRTILTSGLTFLTVLVLFLMGGQVLRAFSFALVVGILVGTYSSFGIAAPLVVAWNKLEGSGRRWFASGTAADKRVTRLACRRYSTMFDDLVESTVEKKKTNKSWTVVLSAIVQA